MVLGYTRRGGGESSGGAADTGVDAAAAASMVRVAAPAAPTDATAAAPHLTSVVPILLPWLPADGRGSLRLVCRAARGVVDAAATRIALSGGRQAALLAARCCGGNSNGHRFTSLHTLTVVCSGPACLRDLARAAALLGQSAAAAAEAAPESSAAGGGRGGLPRLSTLVIQAHPAAADLGGGAAATAATALASKLCALPRLRRLEVRGAALPPGAVDALVSACACLGAPNQFAVA